MMVSRFRRDRTATSHFGCLAAPPLLAAALALGLGACDDSSPSGDSACALAVGDLAFSEIMADPNGDDTQGEWLELYNTTSQSQPLDKLVITYTSPSGSVKTYEVSGAEPVAAGGYYVFGNGVGLSYINHSYGNVIDLSNTSGHLSVSCNGQIIDAIDYGGATGAPTPTPGASVAFDGGVAADALLNDDRAYWCVGSELYDGSNRGTPGARNTACGVSTCREADAFRDVMPPAIGDLVVSEIFADPTGADTGFEWIELYVAAAKAVDLNGLAVEIGATDGAALKRYGVAGLDCVVAEPGAYVVLGASRDSEWIDAVLTDFAVPNGVPLTVRLLRDTLVIDQASLPASKEGLSVRLDDGRASAGGNDLPAAFCLASTAQVGYFAEIGTPGAANGLCGLVTCRDGALLRDVVPPAPLDLFVTELFANPTGSDTGKEWIELYVAARAPVDLNGVMVTLSKTNPDSSRSFTLSGENCIVATPGTYFVIGASNVLAANGGVEMDAVVPNLSIYDGVPIGVTLARDATTIDVASVPQTPEGQAAALDVDHRNGVDNDYAASFCASQVSTVFAEKGSPGAANGACGIAACNDGGTMRPVRALQPGELFVTEVFPNATGADTGKEWIELLVAATEPVDLNDVSIVIRKTNPDATRSITLTSDTCLSAAAGDYVVVGASADAATNGGVPVTVVAPALGFYDGVPLAIDVVQNSVVIDTASIPVAREGVSLSLDPTRLTATANDYAASFCSATTTGLFADTGSPGAANGPCGDVSCRDGASVRPVVPMLAGDLVVSEIFGDATGADTGKEWIELYVAASGPVDLNGLSLVTRKTNPDTSRSWLFAPDDCAQALPGDYLIVGASPDAAANGGITVDLLVPALSLYDGTAMTVELAHQGLLIDAAQVPAATEGVASGLDPLKLDATADDFASSYCAAHTTGLFVETGTPGAANDLCPAISCRDGTAVRPVAALTAGDVLVTEVLADATGGDTGKEWLELYVAAAAAVDLNGLSVVVENTATGSSRTFSIAGEACIIGAPGTYVVVGASSDTAVNGHAQVAVVVPDLSFYDGAPLRLTLVQQGHTIDTASIPAVPAGHSASLDPLRLSATGDDDAGNYCASPTPGNYDDLGTPGLANIVCGIFSCRDGNALRAVDGPAAGELFVSEVFAASAGADTGKEWLELYVAANRAFDLNGLQLTIHKTDPDASRAYTLAHETCLRVTAGSYVVLGASADTAVNGNVAVTAVLEGLSLYDGVPLAIEVARGGVIIDTANVPASVDGKAMSLNPTKFNATDNDVADNFCPSQLTGVFAESGSPGQMNAPCGQLCREGGAGGSVRAVVIPAAGELLVTELLANPKGTSDTSRDFVELYVTGNRKVDLNGLRIKAIGASSTKQFLIDSTDCVSVDSTAAPPQRYAVIGGSNVLTLDNVALTATIGSSSDTTLFPNPAAGSTMTLVIERDTVELDRTSYGNQADGTASSLDPDCVASGDNETPTCWCPATTVYGTTGNKGTPGADNPQCP